MSKLPPSGQGPFQRGERLTAAKLNQFIAPNRKVRAAGRAGVVDDTIVSDESESIYLRVTGRSGANYSWAEVFRLPNGTWSNGTRTGNSTYDWAVERNNETVSAGSRVYEARRSPDTSEWIFANTSNTGGGGTGNITSGETVLMILGTYAEYQNCPNVPPKPPTQIIDYCNQTRGTELCVPAYAYSVYQRCGYVWNKVSDARSTQVWANELNGGSTTAWRRFHIPRWGGNLSSGLPPSDDGCMGVAFLGGVAGSALTCLCPSCMSKSGNLCFSFRTIPRPADPKECAAFRGQMDANSLWNSNITITMAKGASWCSASGSDSTSTFTVNWNWQDGATLDCDWGPDVYDPCKPCDHWGRILADIDVGSNEPNCGGAGHWTGEFLATDICNLLCNCSSPAALPVAQKFCQGCGNEQSPPAVWNAIEQGSVKITCC